MVLLSSNHIFDGGGETPFAGWLGLAGSRIEKVGRGSARGQGGGDRLVDLEGFSLLPGLIDAHSHLGLVNVPPLPGVATAVIAALIFENMRLAISEGFTTVRDLGGLDGGVVEAVNRGLIEGPRILPSGPLISESGGHGDWRHGFAHTPWEGNLPGLVQPAALVDGVAEMRRAGRSAVRDGATQLKVAISGGFSSSFDKLDDVQFSLEELRALVEVAKSRHTYVTGHAHHSESVHLGLEAGLECFEHGTFLDQEAIDAMSAHRASLVATLSVVERYQDPAQRESLRQDLAARAAAAFPAMSRSVEMAVAAGINVGSGSDMTGPSQHARGRELTVRARVTNPGEAVKSATSGNAGILRLQAETGALREGLAADIVAVRGNPLDEPELFSDPDRVVLVVRDGHLCKNILPGQLGEAATAAFREGPS